MNGCSEIQKNTKNMVMQNRQDVTKNNRPNECFDLSYRFERPLPRRKFGTVESTVQNSHILPRFRHLTFKNITRDPDTTERP